MTSKASTADGAFDGEHCNNIKKKNYVDHRVSINSNFEEERKLLFLHCYKLFEVLCLYYSRVKSG